MELVLYVVTNCWAPSFTIFSLISLRQSFTPFGVTLQIIDRVDKDAFELIEWVPNLRYLIQLRSEHRMDDSSYFVHIFPRWQYSVILSSLDYVAHYVTIFHLCVSSLVWRFLFGFLPIFCRWLLPFRYRKIGETPLSLNQALFFPRSVPTWENDLLAIQLFLNSVTAMRRVKSISTGVLALVPPLIPFPL